MVVQNDPCRYVDDAVQLDPSTLCVGPVVPNAKPLDEPVAGVAGAVPCQRVGHDVAHDPQVDFTQIRLGNRPGGAPGGVLG